MTINTFMNELRECGIKELTFRTMVEGREIQVMTSRGTASIDDFSKLVYIDVEAADGIKNMTQEVFNKIDLNDVNVITRK